jgi:hypothetical protein
MRRRPSRLSIVLLSALPLLASLVASAGPPAAAFPPRTTAPESRLGVADLADRLKKGLRVQTPRDMAFCDAVAARVREGEIPVAVVDATFTWAIQRGRKYPFPAFEHVMRMKAAHLGTSFDRR